MRSPDVGDMVGLLVVLWYLIAVGGAVTSMVFLFWMVRPRTPALTAYGLLALAIGVTFVILYGLDIPSIAALARNDVQDIPPSSTFRTALPAALWTLATIAMLTAIALAPAGRIAPFLGVPWPQVKSWLGGWRRWSWLRGWRRRKS